MQKGVKRMLILHLEGDGKRHYLLRVGQSDTHPGRSGKELLPRHATRWCAGLYLSRLPPRWRRRRSEGDERRAAETGNQQARYADRGAMTIRQFPHLFSSPHTSNYLWEHSRIRAALCHVAGFRLTRPLSVKPVGRFWRHTS